MRHTQHNRIPAGLLAVLGLALALPLVVVMFWLAYQWETLDLAMPWLTMVLRVAFFVVPPVYALAFIWQRWGRTRYIDAYHVTQLTRARTQVAPLATSLSYASHNDQAAAPEVPQLAAPVQLSTTPPGLADAIRRGWSTADRWWVGVDGAGEPQQITLKHTGFIVLSGVQGTGKTNGAALLGAQCIAHGGTLFVADPQAGDVQSLAGRVARLNGPVTIAQSPAEVNAMIEKVDEWYTFRNTHPNIYPPLLILLDEFLDMMIRGELSDQSIATLIALSSTGRKKNMFAGLCSANWNIRAVGGGGVAIRQNVTAAMVFNSSIETAALLLPSSYAQQVLTLRPGQCYYFGRGGMPTLTITPELTSADLALGGQAQSMLVPTRQIAPTTRVPTPAVPLTAQLATTIPDQILLLLDGAGRHMTASEIASSLGIDLQVVRVVIGDMYKAGQLARRECQGRTTRERYEYRRSINKRPSGPLVASA